MAGYYTGLFVQQQGKTQQGLIRLLIGGIVLIIAAQLWNLGLPINKKNMDKLLCAVYRRYRPAAAVTADLSL